MSAVNLGTSRIVVLAALVVSGAIVLSSGLGGAEEPVTPSPSEPAPTGPTGTPTGTTSPTPPAPEGQVDGVTVAVFNGTEQAGLAAEVTLALEEVGYTPAQDAADAPTSGVRRTTVYFRGGADVDQNRANAQLLADSELPGAKVARLNPSFADLVTAETQLVIVLGEDQAS